jgi:hypothetical protein
MDWMGLHILRGPLVKILEKKIPVLKKVLEIFQLTAMNIPYEGPKYI